jgi:hypothetical protein
MAQPDWLKGLFTVLPQLKRASLKLLNNIHIGNRIIDNRTIIYENKQTIINLPVTQTAEKEKILYEIPKISAQARAPVILQQFDNLAQDINANINSKDDIETIGYFTGKVPPEDVYILQSSIYIKKVFDRGGDIEELKNGLRNRYGSRGINICNLYSAGYFESWIKPLYENFASSDDFRPESFLEAYELIVNQYPFAIFVHRAMSSKEIEQVADKKIKECLSYGISTLSLHGIGSDNVVTILEAINEIKKKYNFKANMELKDNIIIVKIKIPKES